MGWSSVEVVSPQVEYDSGSTQVTYCYRSHQQNLRIVFYEWPATADNSLRPVIVLVHGICVHARFDFLDLERAPRGEGGKETPPRLAYPNSWVQRLNCLGFDVYALDLQSHGESEGVDGRRAAVEDIDDYAVDVLEFLHIVNDRVNGEMEKTKLKEKRTKSSKNRGKLPPFFYRPIFVAGISLGGCMVLRTTEMLEDEFRKKTCSLVGGKREDDAEYKLIFKNYDPVFLRRVLRGCTLLAPMLSLENVKAQPLNKFLIPFTGVANKFMPSMRLVGVTESPFPHMKAAKYADPLNYKQNLTVRTCLQNLDLPATALEEAKKIGEPLPLSEAESATVHNLVKLQRNPAAFCMFHSLHDTLCDHQGSVKAAEALVHVSHKTVELFEVSGLWHSITTEPSNGVVFRSLTVWLNDVQRRLNDSNSEEYTLLRISQAELLQGLPVSPPPSPKSTRVEHIDSAVSGSPKAVIVEPVEFAIVLPMDDAPTTSDPVEDAAAVPVAEKTVAAASVSVQEAKKTAIAPAAPAMQKAKKTAIAPAAPAIQGYKKPVIAPAAPSMQERTIPVVAPAAPAMQEHKKPVVASAAPVATDGKKAVAAPSAMAAASVMAESVSDSEAAVVVPDKNAVVASAAPVMPNEAVVDQSEA